jgi:hypothetical protein
MNGVCLQPLATINSWICILYLSVPVHELSLCLIQESAFRSNTGISGSNPTLCMDVCVCVLYVCNGLGNWQNGQSLSTSYVAIIIIIILIFDIDNGGITILQNISNFILYYVALQSRRTYVSIGATLRDSKRDSDPRHIDVFLSN